MHRREVILGGVGVLAILGGVGVGSFLRAENGAKYLRPPGAVDSFEALCVKCGQCVQVCPYHSIKLLDLASGKDLGTAYVDFKERGCYLCDLFPCVLACPSGALNHSINDINDVKMGVAIIQNPQNCYFDKPVATELVQSLLNRKIHNDRELAAQNIVKENIAQSCRLCVDSCPVDGAIKMSDNIPQILDSCVGCGVCAEVCFANVIEIKPS